MVYIPQRIQSGTQTHVHISRCHCLLEEFVEVDNRIDGKLGANRTPIDAQVRMLMQALSIFQINRNATTKSFPALPSPNLPIHPSSVASVIADGGDGQSSHLAMPVVTPPTPRLALVHLPTLDDEDEYFLAQAAARDAQLHLPIHGLLFASHNLDMLQLPVTLDPALATGLCYDLRHDPHTARRANLLSGSLGLFIHNPVPTLTHPFPFASPASEPPADLLIVEMAPFGEIHIVHEPIVRCGDVLGQIHNFLWWPLHDPTTIPGAPSLRIVNAHQERTQMKPDLMRNIDALAGKTELLGFELLQDVHTGTRWSARLRQADA